MTLCLRINGAAVADVSHAISLNDRGLSYGDGVFETMLLKDGRVRFLDAHLARLRSGCERLSITPPKERVLEQEIGDAIGPLRSAVVKLLVTRGVGGRGYRPAGDLTPTRIVAVYPSPAAFSDAAAVRWCQTQLARNDRLAGIKHLNRLEQVLARLEPDDERFDEALMLDTEGELVCGTSSNVFIVREGVVLTPDLRFCGVRGVMRSQVVRVCRELGLPVREEPLWRHDLDGATEVFLTSALRGVQCVGSIGERRFEPGAAARSIRAALQL